MFQDRFNRGDISVFLASCGIQVKTDPEKGFVLEDHDELAPNARAVLVKRYGVDVWMILEPPPGQEKFVTDNDYGSLSIRIVLGFLPKVGVAAVLRKLLSMNMVPSRARLALSEQDNSICFVQGVRLPARKDGYAVYEDFPRILDGVVAAYHEHGAQLIKEFGLLQQAP